jgi:hypothetical protein
MSEAGGQGLPGTKAGGENNDENSSPTITATGAPGGDATLAEPAQFRMVLVAFLGAGIGLIAGVHCVLPVQADRAVYQHCLLRPLCC